MAKYIYNGMTYQNYEDIPLSKKDRGVYNSFTRKNPIRCNRAKYMQECYSAILNKGIPNVDLKNFNRFDGGKKYKETLFKIGALLNIPVKETVYGIVNEDRVLKYVEPLKAVLKMFQE